MTPQEVADRAEIHDVIVRYGWAIDTKDWALLDTVFTDDAFGVAERMKGDGVFVVPQPGALRVALCAVPVAAVPRLVDSLARATRPT